MDNEQNRQFHSCKLLFNVNYVKISVETERLSIINDNNDIEELRT